MYTCKHPCYKPSAVRSCTCGSTELKLDFQNTREQLNKLSPQIVHSHWWYRMAQHIQIRLRKECINGILSITEK